MLLTLLRVFPEEVQCSKVGENRRNEIRNELAASAASVFSYLVGCEDVLHNTLPKFYLFQSQVLESYANDQDMIKKVLLCMSCYLQNPALSTDYLASSPLLTTVFQVLVSSFFHILLANLPLHFSTAYTSGKNRKIS